MKKDNFCKRVVQEGGGPPTEKAPGFLFNPPFKAHGLHTTLDEMNFWFDEVFMYTLILYMSTTIRLRGTS